MENIEKDTREFIIDSARKIFSRFGFKKTTMDEIARATRKGKSSLYYYFKSKEEVFQAVVEKEAVELKAELIGAINRETMPQKKLRAYIITRMRLFNRLANLYNAFKDDYLESYSFIEKLRVNYDQYESDMFKKILKEGVERGVFLINNLDLTAYAMVIACKGLEYHWALEQDSDKIETGIDSLLEVFFNGILKK